MDEVLIESGRRRLRVLIVVYMAFSIGAMLFKLSAAGFGNTWPSIVRIWIEVAMWVFIWNGSNAIRNIARVLLSVGFLFGIYATPYLGCLWLATPALTPIQEKAYLIAVTGFAALTGVLLYGAWTLLQPDVIAFVTHQRDGGPVVPKTAERGGRTSSNAVNLSEIHIDT